jgi:predicted 3-demethylubiquinone-9 3-methyltransferase (glyoxalase superfamily)
MEKIIPFLWFNTQAEAAAMYYVSIFGTSKIVRTDRYGDAGPGPKGAVFTVDFLLEGQTFIALNGGPEFNFTPAISFFVTCRTENEADAAWGKLAEGGKVMMPLQKYPFSQKFGWVADRYGVTWQLNLTGGGKKITPFFMFVGKQHGKADEAMRFYVSLFKDSKIEQVERYGPDQPEPEGKVMHARFVLAGQQFMAMESRGQHDFSFTPALSLFVNCATQVEVDGLWEKLSDGGRKDQCGWLQDRYGVSWQIVPVGLRELVQSKDAARSRRAVEAMMKMSKLDIRELQRAYDG